MRTVKESLLNRLAAQADEAELQGLHKVAEALTEQVSKNAENTRSNEAFYLYSVEDLQKDVEANLWNAMVRVADFYDHDLDALQVNEIVEKFASDFVNEMRVSFGLKSVVGAHEPTVPGEILQKVDFEVTE